MRESSESGDEMTRASNALQRAPAQAASRVILSACPSCGETEFHEPFPSTVQFDNSLEPLIQSPDRVPGQADLSPFARSEWRVCSFCGLIFSLARPVYDNLTSWYGPVFEISENRKYNKSPLPALYLESHRKYSNELFDTLHAHNVFDGVRSALHLRCQTGEFLKLLQSKLGIEDVYGAEYFEHANDYANSRLGADRVHLMQGPEPEIDFPVKQFDLIALDHVLTHTHNPRTYFEYLKSLLAPGGKIVIKDKCHKQPMRRAMQYERGINFFHFQLYTAEDLTRFLMSCGMEVQRMPDPSPQRWAVGDGSFHLVCRHGERVSMTGGDVEGNLALMQTWWKKHALVRRLRHAPKPLRRVFGKIIDRSNGGA